MTADTAHARRRSRPIRAVIAGMLFLPTATGCYSNRAIPIERAEPGARVSFGINDRGRVGLSDRMGPGVVRLNGRLTTATDSAYVVSVSSVEFLGTGSSRWSGEQVRLPRDYVGTVEERKLSRGRTWLVSGLVAAAIVVFAVTASLIGGGHESTDTGDGGHDGSS